VKWHSVKGKGAWLSPGWEVPAGFCTASNTPSPPPLRTLESMAQNCKQLSLEAGLGEEVAWAFLNQVHGVQLKKAQGLGKGEIRYLGEADGLWTEQPGVALAVQTADCVPVLFLDSHRRRVAAVHAGWRGVWGRIVLELLNTWHKEGSRLEDIQVALGPCIGACPYGCYEVSEALAQQFSARWGQAVLCKAEGALKPALDLAKALELDMLGAGVLPEKLQNAHVCTFCDTRFHSFRREKGNAGRQLSWVLCSF